MADRWPLATMGFNFTVDASLLLSERCASMAPFGQRVLCHTRAWRPMSVQDGPTVCGLRVGGGHRTGFEGSWVKGVGWGPYTWDPRAPAAALRLGWLVLGETEPDLDPSSHIPDSHLSGQVASNPSAAQCKLVPAPPPSPNVLVGLVLMVLGWGTVFGQRPALSQLPLERLPWGWPFGATLGSGVCELVCPRPPPM